ncbi:MAG: peptidylprolyl isomerase [Desulfurococcales archaeon]|nr:peptidylprolyl isomerase [Desulfurococcales archaeon]
MPLKEGSLVLLEYTIKVVEDGRERIVDTTSEEVAKKAGIYDPERRYGDYPVIVGKSALLEAVEEALKDMNEGETREITAPPEKAYGPYNEKLVIKVPIKRLLSQGIRPHVGMELEVGGRKGRIVRLTQRFAYIDLNHPLAGKTLKITLTVKKVIEEDDEKAKYLAFRWFGVSTERVEVSKEDERLVIKLPPETLTIKDLEVIVTRFLQDIYTMTNAKGVRLVVDVEFKREEPKEEGEGEAEEKSEEQTAEDKEG